MSRIAKIPPATSNANSRIEFKLEVIDLIKCRIDMLTREKETLTSAHHRDLIEKCITEFRTFRMEIESIEFKVTTRTIVNKQEFKQ